MNIFVFAIQRTIYHHRCWACTKDERNFHKSQMFGHWGSQWMCIKLLLPYLSDRTNIQLQWTHNFNIQLCFFESQCKCEYTTSRLEWWHRHRIMECFWKKRRNDKKFLSRIIMEVDYTGVHRKPSEDSNRSSQTWMDEAFNHFVRYF